MLEGPDLILGARALLASRGNGRASSPAARSPRPLALDSVRPFVDAPPAAVSEGAYVPRARYLENLPSRWRLVAERCARCSSLTFPARGVCRSCSAREGLTEHPLPLDGGRVVATTTIGQGGQPTEFDLQVASLGDYGVVLVELAPGIRLTLQVTDGSSADLPIGARVSTRLRRLYPMDGEWRYGRKAAPFEAPPSDVLGVRGRPGSFGGLPRRTDPGLIDPFREVGRIPDGPELVLLRRRCARGEGDVAEVAPAEQGKVEGSTRRVRLQVLREGSSGHLSAVEGDDLVAGADPRSVGRGVEQDVGDAEGTRRRPYAGPRGNRARGSCRPALSASDRR